VEVERRTYRPPGIVFVRRRDAKHGHKALPHHEMEPSPILAHHVLSQRMEFQEQAVQGIQIKTRSLGRFCGHRTAEHCDGFALGLVAGRRRCRAGRRWRRKRLPTGRAECSRQRHVLATVDTKLPQSDATRRAENRALVIRVLT
jgi:hypothetical protein